MHSFKLNLLVLALPFLTFASPVPQAGAGCKPTILIFARGTTEPGTLGTVVGPPLVRALEARAGRGNVDARGVPYAADIPGFLVGGDRKGSATMAQMVTEAVNSCPGSTIIMSGYRYVFRRPGQLTMVLTHV